MNICECEKLNPLYRDGTNQLQRLLKTLEPSYVSVDEHSLEEILIYIKKYSEYLRYVDSTDDKTADTNWLSFIENDVTVFIAEIIKTDIAELRKDFNRKYEGAVNPVNDEKLQALFEFLILEAQKIDRWYIHSVKELSLNKDLFLIIRSSLQTALNDLLSFYKTVSSKRSYQMKVYKFSEIWEIDYENIPDDDTKFIADDEITDEAAKKFTSAFEIIYNAFSKIVSVSPDYMTEALEKYPQHQPHFALLLAFIKLFKFAQDNINTITKRHLDFYYKRILHLEEKSEVPDQVHLIFELAKNFSTYTLAKGTLLKAGKDDTGKDAFYQTDKELVVNTAVVSELKTVFLDRYTKDDELLVRNIYAAPFANSADGLGKKFTEGKEKWKPFGESQQDANNRTMVFADTGFAIASPQFILKEGKRTVTLAIKVSNSKEELIFLPDSFGASGFKFYFSGKKEWFEVESYKTENERSPDVSFNNNTLTITLILLENNPEVCPYDKNKLGGSFDTNYPVLKVLLDNEKKPYSYEYLKDLQIEEININVSVTGVKNLIIQNDVGKLDSKKPFQPFGNSPVIGSAFYIGSEEIFNKSLLKLVLHFDWLGIPDEGFKEYYAGYGGNQPADESVFKVHTQIIDQKQWKPETTIENNLFQAGSSIEYNNLPGSRRDVLESFTELSYDLDRGFIKLSLAGHDFCHKDYANTLTTTIVNKENNPVAIPKAPYTPLMKSITVNYDSNEKFDSRFEQFYHIYPFGEVETLPVKISSATTTTADSLVLDTKDLVPQFKFNDEEHEGILFLGISKLVPPQNLALLFQIVEGSGDPTLEVPGINWCYLSNNNWRELEKNKILSDSTNGFKTTGIIEFDFPSDATNTNTIMPSGYHWLSASVAENSAAVNQIIEILAQAVTASFNNNGNDPNYLLNPLEAKAISKLETRVPEIKSVTQPFASFGGKVKEQSSEFYRRVSERLRHKNRAVNIWDYERLILENFPSIYKVKCINHTGTNSEIYPGCVTIIPISNLRNINAVDILEPRTSVNILDEIKKYLRKYNSMFITLEVENPKYEKIKTKFCVKFYKGIDKGTYTKNLKEDIIKFLSPWAFDESSDIAFGGKIHASNIIYFIEKLSYVDYITDFEMYHILDETIPVAGVEVAQTTTAKSILASYDDHEVTIID